MDRHKKQLEETKVVSRATARMHASEQRGITTRYAIKYGCLAFCALCGTISSYWLGGEATAKVAEAMIKAFSSDPVGRTSPWLVAGGGVLYGLLYRKLLRDHIEQSGGRFKGLEQFLDPNRSSSNLTKRGDTAPEDRIT